MNEQRRVAVMHPRTEAALRGRSTSPRSLDELRDRTEVGDVLVDSLRRAQLALSLRIAAVVGLIVAGVPIAFALFPRLGTTAILGVRVPWIVLGAGLFPVLLVAGIVSRRGAERLDAEFEAFVERG